MKKIIMSLFLSIQSLLFVVVLFASTMGAPLAIQGATEGVVFTPAVEIDSKIKGIPTDLFLDDNLEPIEVVRKMDCCGNVYFEFEGTATLNGNPYISGTRIYEKGDYILIVQNGVQTETIEFFIQNDTFGLTLNNILIIVGLLLIGFVAGLLTRRKTKKEPKVKAPKPAKIAPNKELVESKPEKKVEVKEEIIIETKKETQGEAKKEVRAEKKVEVKKEPKPTKKVETPKEVKPEPIVVPSTPLAPGRKFKKTGKKGKYSFKE